MSTTNTDGGHRLLPKADRKHTEPIPEHLLGWLSAFGLDLTDTDDSFQVFRRGATSGAVGAAWGPAVDDRDVWFAMDWRNPKEACRVTGGRDGALRHILRGEEIRQATYRAKLGPELGLLIAEHEHDETIFGGFFCSTGCMTSRMEAGYDELTAWPCAPLRAAGMTDELGERFVLALREVYGLGRWPASRAQAEAHR